MPDGIFDVLTDSNDSFTNILTHRAGGGDSVIDEGGRFTDNVNKNVIKPVGNVVQSVIDFGKDLF